MACSTSGVLHGRWQAAPKAGKHKKHHRQSRDILIDYIQNASATSGILRVVVPSGEIFKGKFLQITTTSTSESIGMSWGMWDPYWGDWGPFDDPWYGGRGFTTFRKNYSGKVVATLMGNRGGTMRCRIHLAEPGEGLDGGGVLYVALVCLPNNENRLQY